jgi:hypothetical protein
VSTAMDSDGTMAAGRIAVLVAALAAAVASMASCAEGYQLPPGGGPSGGAKVTDASVCAAVLGTEDEDQCPDAELVALSRAQRKLVQEMTDARSACAAGAVEDALHCYAAATCDPVRAREERLEEEGYPFAAPEGALATGPICGE